MRWILVLGLALAVVVACAGPAAADCAPLDELGLEFDLDVLVLSELRAGEFDGADQLVRVEILAVRVGDVAASDQLLISHELWSGDSTPLEVGQQYRVAGTTAPSGTGTLRVGGCDTAAPVDAETESGDANGSRTIGVVTMVIALLGIGFAYIRTKRRVSHWD